METDNILGLMVAHHKFLEALFATFKEKVDSKNADALAILVNLRWEVKKHFFAEESSIFDLPQIKAMGLLTVVTQLKAEHDTMLEELESFENNFEAVNIISLENFHNLLESHRKIEELNLYPRLDKEISIGQKAQIILHINEIPIIK
ncbi:MAG: hemerythrin domain-containing protein [Candidatus Staskawiczbacteria bacterium]|nr:hemerythrin domain-containing protein [Candidatus Staskawiczbacteria bacterium]